MRFSTAVRLSVLIALFAVPADALAATTIRPSSVTGRLVAGARPGTMRLHCPPTAVALNGAVARRGAGVAILGSRPGRDAGGWTFRAVARGTGSRSMSAVLRCVRLDVPSGLSGVRLDVRTRHRPGIAIAPGGTAAVRLGCGPAWTATGYALDGGNDAVRLAQARPLAHGWRFTLENTASTTAHGRMSIRCIRTRIAARRAGGGTAELLFDVTRPSFSTTFPRGGPQIDGSGCRAGRFNLAAGGSLDPASTIELITATPLRERGARWRFARPGDGDRFTGHTVCLSRRSRFH